MTQAEFFLLAKALKAVYTKDNFLSNKESIEVWYQLLGDLDYTVANTAVQKYMLSGKFPPTIADIRLLATEISMPPMKQWSDGWEEVLRAIRRYGRYQELEALNSMSELTRRVVKKLGFINICNSENISADRANFRMIYEQSMEEEKRKFLLPQHIVEAIEEKKCI